jgi:hypothetical protein
METVALGRLIAAPKLPINVFSLSLRFLRNDCEGGNDSTGENELGCRGRKGTAMVAVRFHRFSSSMRFTLIAAIAYFVQRNNQKTGMKTAGLKTAGPALGWHL